MPVAGDEGYEQLLICPYDKSHEVRKGRMQFHLDKCRKNFPEKSKELVQCPFNSVHLIPKCEESFHLEQECSSRLNWDRRTHEVGDVKCPVKNLVPVVDPNANVDSEENWDSFEAQGSVLNAIKQKIEEKPILRMMQCESRAKRKNFRMEERRRLLGLADDPKTSAFNEKASAVMTEAPVRRPTTIPSIPINRQDPKVALATLNSAFQSFNLRAETSTVSDVTPESLSKQPSAPHPKPVTTATLPSRPGSLTSSISRPPTAFSWGPNFGNQDLNDGSGFCQVPIPGLGRGSRSKSHK